MNDQTLPPEGADGDLGYLLTAYADGQLALEGMAWVEEQLDRRPELRARLKEIRAVQAALRAEFARFPAPTELGGFARGQVLAAAQRGRPSSRRQWALAALLVIGVSVSVMAVMVTMGESAAMRVTTLDDATVLSRSDSPAPAPPSTIGQPGPVDLADVPEQRGGVDANMAVSQDETVDASEDKRGEGVKAELDGKELTSSGAFMSIGAGGARHPRRSAGKPGAADPSSAADLAVADPRGQVEGREKDVEVQRQAAMLKKQDEDGEATRSSVRVSGFTSTSPVEGLTDQLAANAAKPAPVAPVTVAAVQPELAAAGGGRTSGGKRRAGADAARSAAAPAGPVAQDGRQEAAATRGPTAGEALDRPASPSGGVAYATSATAPAAPVAGDAGEAGDAEQERLRQNILRFGAHKFQTDDAKTGLAAADGEAKPTVATPPPSSAVNGVAARGGQAAPPAAPDDPDARILHLQQELARGPAPAEEERLTRSLADERRKRHIYLRQIQEPSPAEKGAAAATDGGSLAGRFHVELHKSLVPQNEPLAYDDAQQPADPFGILQGSPAAPGQQAQSTPVPGNADKTHMAQVERAAAFQLGVKLGEVEDDPDNTHNALAQREGDPAKRTTGANDGRAKLSIGKEGYPKVYNSTVDEHQSATFAAGTVDGSMLVDSAEALGSSATPSQRLAAGNAQRAPRDRVAALLATASVNATAPLATLLRTTAGPDGALAASPALDEVLARPAHLETHDLPSGQALLQLVRGAGLQARVLGGVLTLDAARGQLDPTDTQGLDRATFTKAFGTVPMVATADDARSTFALDANTASFERARAQLRAGQAPDPAAIQAEHFINAMPMDYPAAQGPEAFALYAEAAPSPFAVGAADAAARAPWAGRTAVVAIGAVARPAAPDERRPLHLTLALDCSGSMAQPGGLDRVRLGLEELLTHLRPVDTVAVVAFSDQARVVLPATPGGDPAPIARALAGLVPGGATNAVEGLALAYQLAAEHLEPGSENRVLFATDGGTLAGADAQVVIERVAAYKSRGITLLVVGCGGTDYQGRTLQQLADRADGQHVFLGSDDEARSAFASRLLPERLAVLAKDAKVQVTWNPQRVSHFRLIGYEQRRLAHQDFRNDAVDAGEISHDTQVTALYEVLLVDGATGPLGSAAVRYFDTRLQQVRELSCPLAGAVLQAEPGQRLRLVACAAEFAAWLQRGWWSNVRPTTPARLLGELARCPQPQARELEELLQRAAALQPQPVPSLHNVAPNQAVPKP